jgi:hypothetical protein
LFILFAALYHLKPIWNNFDDGYIDIDIDVNNLSPEMNNILNSPITIEEIQNVVKGLKNGKSLGIDGVT